MINEIVQGDCLQVMPQIPRGSIDMILCDLPYGVTAQNKWDQIIPVALLWEEYKRVIKPNGAIVLTATQPFASLLIGSNPKMFRYDLIWVKNNVTGFLNAKKMPLRQHESVLVFYEKLPVYNPQMSHGHNPVHAFTKLTSDGSNYGKTKPKLSGGGSTSRYPTSVINIPVINNDDSEKTHPTQKPVALFEYLIRTYSNEGELILDNCIGSGTTAIACLNSKRRYIGIEMDATYVDVARRRVAAWK